MLELLTLLFNEVGPTRLGNDIVASVVFFVLITWLRLSDEKHVDMLPLFKCLFIFGFVVDWLGMVGQNGLAEDVTSFFF